MRKTFRFLSGCAIAALMLGGLASCEDKDIDAPDSPGVADRDITQYMAVTISAPKDRPFGRALTENFEDGAPSESKIDHLDFFFFNNAGDAASTPCNIKDIKPTLDAPGTNSVTTYASVVVEVATAQAANLPTQTICFANLSTDDVTALKGKSIDAIREYAIANFSNSSNFIMSNSVYYGTNILNPTTVRICATPITTKLFDTSDDAQEAIDNGETSNILDVYIERLAAKIGLDLDPDNIQPYTLVWGDAPKYTTDAGSGTNLVHLTFNPTYWFMNATSKTEFITKRFGLNNDGTINWKPEYSDVNDAMNNGGMANAWNNANRFRSYWGCSPSYYVDVEKYPNNAGDVNTTTTPVNYWTYAQVKSEGDKTTIDRQALKAVDGGFTYVSGSHTSATEGTAASGCIYTWETTTAINNIKSSSNPAATVVSAVLTGTYSYQTQLDGATTPNTTVVEATDQSDFYIDTKHGTVKVDGKDVLHGTFYSTKEAATKALIAKQDIVYKDVDGTKKLADATDVAAFDLKHPNIDDLASRLVALQLKEDNTSTYYIYNATTGAYDPITGTNIATVNSNLILLGYFDRYNQGLATFTIPIRHLGFNENPSTTAPNYDATTKQYNWANMRVGDLGVVRNHVYHLNITEIGGLGTGIFDPSTPIVPPVETIKQFIAVKLNVLSWRVVPTQNVPL